MHEDAFARGVIFARRYFLGVKNFIYFFKFFVLSLEYITQRFSRIYCLTIVSRFWRLSKANKSTSSNR